MLKRKDSGRSMIEMLGVLAVVGILSAGGIAGYTTAMKNYRANKAMESFQLTSTQIITSFQGEEDFSKLQNQNNITKLNLDLYNPYGGSIAVNGGNGFFTLTMTNIPEQACIKISQSPWGDDYAFGESAHSKKYTSNPFTCASDNNTLVLTYQPGISSYSGNTGGNNNISAGNNDTSTGNNDGNNNNSNDSCCKTKTCPPGVACKITIDFDPSTNFDFDFFNNLL